MSDRQKLLAVDIFLYIVGIILIVAVIINPTAFEYECGKFDIFCFDYGFWSILGWFAGGIGLIAVGVVLTLILWAGR